MDRQSQWQRIAEENEITKVKKWLDSVTSEQTGRRVKYLSLLASPLLFWRNQNRYWNIGLPVIIAMARCLSPQQWATVERRFPDIYTTETVANLINRCKDLPSNWDYFRHALEPELRPECVAEAAFIEFQGDKAKLIDCLKNSMLPHAIVKKLDSPQSLGPVKHIEQSLKRSHEEPSTHGRLKRPRYETIGTFIESPPRSANPVDTTPSALRSCRSSPASRTATPVQPSSGSSEDKSLQQLVFSQDQSNHPTQSSLSMVAISKVMNHQGSHSKDPNLVLLAPLARVVASAAQTTLALP